MILFGKDKQQKELEKQQKELAKQQKEQQKEFPFVNGTPATINIEEYEVCTSIEDEANLRAHQEGGLNTLDPFVVASLKNISMISMQNCIYLNSANQP